MGRQVFSCAALYITRTGRTLLHQGTKPTNTYTNKYLYAQSIVRTSLDEPTIVQTNSCMNKHLYEQTIARTNKPFQEQMLVETNTRLHNKSYHQIWGRTNNCSNKEGCVMTLKWHRACLLYPTCLCWLSPRHCSDPCSTLRINIRWWCWMAGTRLSARTRMAIRCTRAAASTQLPSMVSPLQ